MLAGVVAFLLAPSVLDLDLVFDDPQLKGATVAVVVQDSSGRLLYSRNPDALVMPGSNQKILSCAFALEKLGTAWRYRTEIWRDGNDLVVKASGDPSITKAQIVEARRTLRPAFGAQLKLVGPWKLDYPPTWEIDDTPYGYAPKIQCFTYNLSAVEVFAKAGRLHWDRDGGVAVHYKSAPEPLRRDYGLTPGSVALVGELPKDDGRIANVPMPHPTGSAARLLGAASWHWGTDVPNRRADFVIESRRLPEILKDCLEPSDNMIAEHLVLTSIRPSSDFFENPYKEVGLQFKEWLIKRVNLPEDSVRPVDGSGMSRHNLVTARAMARCLQYISSQAYADSFIEAMAAPGEGTLRSRLKGENVVAKTGTLDTVSALSGYVGEGKDKLIFSVIFNHALCSTKTMHEIQDRAVLAMKEYVGADQRVVANRS